MNRKENWFAFGSVFEYSRGTRLIEKKQTPGEIAYISSTKMNNGISSFISPPDNIPIYENKMTLSNSGSVGYLFFHEYPFVASDHVTVISIKDKNVTLNVGIALYLKPILEAMRCKYNFGREISDSRLAKEKVLLPVNDDGTPDWDYMNATIKQIRKTVKWNTLDSRNTNTLLSLSDVLWKDFTMESVFVIKKGKRLTKANIVEGTTNFIGAISGNNGIREKISEEPLYEGNCITVNYNGSVGEAYYQESPFWASDDVNVLLLKENTLNKYIALFLITIIRHNKYHFDFGRKWNVEKMKKTLIRLPMDDNGAINWTYMEEYIKQLPLGKYLR
ncbi:MAG: restriction endonuclease [Lachnospiraceae bacterium]|nr:restriction endonuclease [Lachnospiraceae bacterium]